MGRITSVGTTKLAYTLASSFLLASCGGGGGGSAALPSIPQRFPTPTPTGKPTNPPQQKIQHVIVVIQENRTTDNLFQFLPGADTSPSGVDKKGKVIPLRPVSLVEKTDIKHEHADFVSACDADGSPGCKMDGWNGEQCNHKCPRYAPYAFVPPSEVKPYYDLAEQYTFGDRMFQTNQGPSFPAHQYFLSGTSSIYTGSTQLASENAGNHLGGCDSPSTTLVKTINPAGEEGDQVFPCFDRASILDELDAAGISWKYYQANGGAGIWNGVDALKPIWLKKSEYASNVVYPSKRFLTQVESGSLSAVTFVTPSAAASDHAGVTDGTGPDWVGSVVNAVGKSPLWEHTAIVVVWDDWGGWYDHVKPTLFDSYSDGMRVPFIVISPYAKEGYVSHAPYEFGSILKFIETNFGLPSLGTTDVRSNNLGDMFDFNQAPRRFKKINTRHSIKFFERLPADPRIVDAD